MFPIEFFFRAARRSPDRAALVSAERTLSFSALRARVEACAAGLQAIDPAFQSRVGICAANSIDHIVALLATLAAGKTWVPLNPRNGNAELNRFVAFTEPSIVICDAANAGRLDTGKAALILADGAFGGGGPDTLDALAAKHAGMSPQPIEGRLDDPQAIKFTGGTTGLPKGVMQPYRAWNTNIVTQFSCFGLGPNDRYLIVAPITHGTSTYVIPTLGAGGALVLPEDAKPAGILDAIDRHAITLLFMPPTLIYAVMAEQAARPRRLSSLRHLVYGAAPMRPEKIAEARALFGEVMATSYGQTEAPQTIAFMGPADFRDPANLSSVGRPTLVTEVAILDAEGRRLPAGAAGEIAVRGDLIMSGYWRMPDKTAETIRKGWLHTGDVGMLDERGFLFLKDRSRDVIITGGFNVYPSDVENVLGQHPAVYDCSVVGLDDDKWGEAVHAAVELRPGHAADEREIIGFIKRQLDSVKAPKAVHFFESLPRSSVGKTLKTEIRQEIAQRLLRRS